MLPLSETAFDALRHAVAPRSPNRESLAGQQSLRSVLEGPRRFGRPFLPGGLSEVSGPVEARGTCDSRGALSDYRSLEESLQSRTPSLCVGWLKEYCAVTSQHPLIVVSI